MKKLLVGLLTCAVTVTSVSYANAEVKSEKVVKQTKSNQASSKAKVAKLTDKEKVALLLSNDAVGKYIPTAKELKKGSYVVSGNTGKKTVKISKLNLKKHTALKNVPKHTNVYDVSATKGPFGVSLIVSKSKVTVFPAQNGTTYENMVKNGKTFDLNKLYDQYSKTDYKKTAEKIGIVKNK